MITPRESGPRAPMSGVLSLLVLAIKCPVLWFPLISINTSEETAMPLPAGLLLLVSALLILSGNYHAEGVDIHDNSGDPIKAGGAYYLFQQDPRGGGVTLSGQDPARPGACPDKLALTGTPSDTGIPVRLSPQKPSAAKTVAVGAPVRIQFGVLFRCIPTTWWALQKPTSAGAPTYLVPGRKDNTFDWFRVGFDKAANDYFLQYCKGASCQEIGIKVQGSSQFLVLGGTKFRFVFQIYGPGAAVDGQSQRIVD